MILQFSCNLKQLCWQQFIILLSVKLHFKNKHDKTVLLTTSLDGQPLLRNFLD